MTVAHSSALLVVACGLVGCVGVGPSSAIVLPTRVDVGPMIMQRGAETTTAMRFADGVYWGSLSSRHVTPFDVGVGYGVERFTDASPARVSVAAGTTQQAPHSSGPSDGGILHGPFLELGINVGGERLGRGWLGLRSELLLAGGDDRVGTGLALRIAGEVVAATRSDFHDGMLMGALGAGAFVEAGIRWLPDGAQATQVTMGVSLRLPLIYVGK